jgi:hypothetical protein
VRAIGFGAAGAAGVACAARAARFTFGFGFRFEDAGLTGRGDELATVTVVVRSVAPQAATHTTRMARAASDRSRSIGSYASASRRVT